jgi:hypothetical protein
VLGVDDFDESWPSSYERFDSIGRQLKTARKLGLLSLTTKLTCEFFSIRVQANFKEGGCPILRAEHERHLEKLGMSVLKTPKDFWKKFRHRPTLRGRLPQNAKKGFRT